MLLYHTGFEGYGTGQPSTILGQLGWNFSPNGYGASWDIRGGRISGNCAYLLGSWAEGDTYTIAQRSFPSSETVTIGAAVAFGNVGQASYNYHAVFCFQDGGTVQLIISPFGGYLKAYLGDAQTLLATGTTPLANGIWYYIEAKIKFHNNGLGTVEVRVNDIVQFSLTNVTTALTINNYANVITLRSCAWSARYFDDLYILDGTDSGIPEMPNNTFLGDVRIIKCYPNGAGTSTQFDVYNAASNYQAVDEEPPNSDTDYVESGVVGNQDLYAYSDLTISNAIVYGMAVHTYAKKDTVGSRVGEIVINTNSTTYEGVDMALSAGSYQIYREAFELNPVTDDQWTADEVNNIQIGVKVKA